MKKVGKIVSLVVVVLLLAVLGMNAFATVPVGSTGILLTFGRHSFQNSVRAAHHFHR